MNLPKRWIETESGSTPLERALLRPALQVDVPDDAEQRIWATIIALAPLSAAGAAAFTSSTAVAAGSAGAGAGTAGAATAAASAGATTAAASAGAATAAASAGATTAIASGGVKLGLGVIVKAFAIGAASGTLLVGGLSTIESGRSSHQKTPPAPVTATSAADESRLRSGLSRVPAAGAPTDPAALPTAPAARYPELPPRDPASSDRLAEGRSVSAFPSVPSPAGSVAANPASKEPSSRLGEEARVLRGAREALRRGNLGAAFAALEVARTEFPRGALGEEREALTIELLARSGQRDAASARAAAFLRLFPGSAHAANVRKFAD